MNNRKSKARKRKLSDLEESSSDDSSDKGDDLDSDVEERNIGDEEEDGCSSDSSQCSSESQSSSDSNSLRVRRTKSASAGVLLSDSSESGDENSEKCAICLRSITSQEVGNPEVCDHLFCSVCIIEWSKNSNVCPLDRQQFSIILVRENKDGSVAKKVPVEEPHPARVDNVELEELEDTVCEICGSGDREDILLLCDICDRGFHTVCLTPPLENIPDENEWFCPECDYRAPNPAESLAEFFDVPSTSRSLRPRIQMVRTRLLERIRVTVNRIVENYVLQHPDELESSEEESVLESFGSGFSSGSDAEGSDVEPGSSRPGAVQGRKKPVRGSKRRVTKSRGRSRKRTSRKRKTTSARKTPGRKRKGKTRKTRVKTTRTKRVKVENEDGTITEKIVKTRTYKKRRQKKKKYKVKTLGAVRRGLRVKSVTTPKTVKGRLALTLGMVPPRKPGQLLPDVKVRPPNSHVTAIDLNRARAGIPKLHIFGPRDELQYYSSESEQEEFIGGGSGGVATVVPQRSAPLRLRDRKKAVLALQSAPPGPKPKHVIEAPRTESVDILGSILDSQALWHSKNTNVKINEDGSVEVIKEKGAAGGGRVTGGKGIDVRGEKPEGLTTQAPMYPGTGSRPAGGFRPHGRTAYGEARTRAGDSALAPRGGQTSAGVNFNRFGAPARNDREGYANYLNNMPQGPTPFCRGGPPLRFRMPPRQQLRRITIPVRNRPGWQRGEEGEEGEGEGEGENAKEKEGKEEKGEKGKEPAGKKQEEEEDLDLYSDIETNAEKTDNSGGEDGGPNYPALGPPPEPPAFLLSLEENGDLGGGENRDKSQVYDPAEPCDSEEEMVIEEKKEGSPPGEKSDPPRKDKAPSPAEGEGGEEEEEEEDNDEDCPIFSIYSSATREFSQKEEEERQREIAEDRRKIEEMKLHETKEICPSPVPVRESRSRSKSPADEKVAEVGGEEGRRRSPSSESEKEKMKSPGSAKDKSSSPEGEGKKGKRKSKSYNSDSEGDEGEKGEREERERRSEDEEKGGGDSGSETVSQKVATGLEGLDVEEVSSDNEDEGEFSEKRSMSSLSLSELSNGSKRSRSPVQSRKKKKGKKKKAGKSKGGKNYEEGEIDDSEKDNRGEETFAGGKNGGGKVGNENAPKGGEKKRRRSSSTGSERQILGSKENKKGKGKSKDRDLSWKKPSKKDKNYREGKKRSKERGRSRSGDRRKSKSPTPKKDKKKNKDRKKKTEKKKELERYDVRKIVKNKEVRKTDAFGRDIVSKSRSGSRSRSRTPVRGRSRNMLRRDSRSFSRSRSRSFRRGRSPVRRRYLRSRTRTRSNSPRRSYSRSRSRSRSRKSKRKPKEKERMKGRSRSRGRKSRSGSRRRRSGTRTRSRSPGPRTRGKKTGRSRRSWSHHASRSPSFSPRRSRSVTRSPVRVRRSYTRSASSRSWSRGRSPLPRTSSLEKLTVVLTTKDKKKKKKEGKKTRKEEKKRRKVGNSKEVFASGDNVLVSVNFRNNANSGGGNAINSESRGTRLNSSSPVPDAEPTRKKKKGSDYESERVVKKGKKPNPISKKAVDVALSCPKRAKKLTRLSEKDAEVILNRKPVAVIDLDMSPYREQTPSPVNVVVVSDSGSGDEGKEHTPQRANPRGTPAAEVEIIQENVVSQSANVSAPSSPLENGYVATSGPKTPPEPQIKFSINKPQQLRQIANPLGDDDDEEEEGEGEGEQRVESLDRRIEKELNARSEAPHKGPNTPPAPRGPSTPKTPPSPQTSPDAYDPFEPTKSRSPSPSQADKENRPSPKVDGKVEEDPAGGPARDGESAPVTKPGAENGEKGNDVILENHEDKADATEKGEATPAVECPPNAGQGAGAPVSDVAESPERKIGVIVTGPQSKGQSQTGQKPVVKTLPVVSTPASSASTTTTTSSDAFSMPSPTKTTRSGPTPGTQTLQMTGIQRLQHRLGSPVSRTPNSVKSTPEKRSTPRPDSNEVPAPGNYVPRNAAKRNGDQQQKQPRPLQDATNETIDMTMDLDDSPYSPASSEGDDLFDPPVEPPKPSQSNSKPPATYKPPGKPAHKSPAKQLTKFDLLFGPTLSPMKAAPAAAAAAGQKKNAKVPAKTTPATKPLPQKPPKKPTVKKNVMHKMDEDQLRILDDLPSSAVELQVKDKFLKKLNRQERVVDEVKTVLKPHYARKHITKEEYKDILRRSVPKICHSRSGEINPSKIQSLIEAYVRKFRHAKKKGINAVSKPKSKKTMFS